MSRHKELRKLIKEVEIELSDKEVWASFEISDHLLDKVHAIIMSQQIIGHLYDKNEPFDVLKACVLDEMEMTVKEKSAIKRLESIVNGEKEIETDDERRNENA